MNSKALTFQFFKRNATIYKTTCLLEVKNSLHNSCFEEVIATSVDNSRRKPKILLKLQVNEPKYGKIIYLTRIFEGCTDCRKYVVRPNVAKHKFVLFSMNVKVFDNLKLTEKQFLFKTCIEKTLHDITQKITRSCEQLHEVQLMLHQQVLHLTQRSTFVNFFNKICQQIQVNTFI